MCLEDRELSLERALDDILRPLRRPDETEPRHHALPDHLGRTPHRLVVGARHRLARDPLGAGYLVGLVEPAEMKHRLVAPFVGILLDERRQERERRIRRMDRRLRMARFERFDDRGGVLHRGAVRREHERDQRQTGMALELFEGARVTHHPGVRDLLVAEVRAHLQRAGAAALRRRQAVAMARLHTPERTEASRVG